MRSVFFRWCVQWNVSTMMKDEVCADGTITFIVLRVWHSLPFSWSIYPVFVVFWDTACLCFWWCIVDVHVHCLLSICCCFVFQGDSFQPMLLFGTQLVSVLNSTLVLCMFMGCLSLSSYRTVVNCWWCDPSGWCAFWYIVLCSVWKCLCRRSIWWKKSITFVNFVPFWLEFWYLYCCEWFPPGASIAFCSCHSICVVCL